MTLFRHLQAICILAIIAVCTFAPGQSRSQSPELGAAFKEYQKFNQKGKYAEAIPFAKEVVELTKSEFGPEHKNNSASLNNLAGLHKSLGRCAEAELLYKRSLAIQEKALGPEHPTTAVSLNNLARLPLSIFPCMNIAATVMR